MRRTIRSPGSSPPPPSPAWTGELPRAQADIARALGLAADDAQVQLEAGNIAAAAGDAAKAQAARGGAAGTRCPRRAFGHTGTHPIHQPGAK
ncbi:hypothetical protein AB5I41_19515 [Sphingomonas sp. MMS24-JH45]